MPLGKSITIQPARPLVSSSETNTLWEASARRADLEEAFGTSKVEIGCANIVVTVAAEERRVGDLYQLILDPQLSWLVDVHDEPYVLIVNSSSELGFYDERNALADLDALDARLRRLPIPDLLNDIYWSTTSKGASEIQKGPVKRDGDQMFIQKLPEGLRMLGEAILGAVRKKHDGDLKYYTSGDRYVETPDNFWTVKIQPRAKSLVITVRGLPGSFHGDADFEVSPKAGASSALVRRLATPSDGKIELKRDRGSSSRFTLKDQAQLETAGRIIEWAAKNRR